VLPFDVAHKEKWVLRALVTPFLCTVALIGWVQLRVHVKAKLIDAKARRVADLKDDIVLSSRGDGFETVSTRDEEEDGVELAEVSTASAPRPVYGPPTPPNFRLVQSIRQVQQEKAEERGHVSLNTGTRQRPIPLALRRSMSGGSEPFDAQELSDEPQVVPVRLRRRQWEQRAGPRVLQRERIMHQSRI